MNNQTFIQKIKSFVSRHKFLSLAIVLVLVFGIYYIFFRNKNSAEVRYVTSEVAKGSIISSVSGTGQIESSDSVNINAKTSGDINYVAVKVGQSVNKGDLIASVDSRDAKIALENAKLSLSKLKTPSTLTVLQKENSLSKSYSDGWNNVSSFIVDADTIIVGLKDLHDGYLGAQNRMLLGKAGKDKINQSEAAYYDSQSNLDDFKKLYNSLSRNSSNEDIENLIGRASDVSRKISNAVKLAQASFDYTYDYLDKGDTTESTSAQKDLTSWGTTANGYVNSIISNLNSIKENKQSLADTVAGADELDIRQSELNVETKQNAYNDCFIRAPFDGIIASLTAKVGQSASGTIGTLITKQKLVKITLNEVDISKIKLDQKTTLTFDAIEDLTITGSVIGIDSVGTVSQGVVSYAITIGLDIDDSRVKPGMSVAATIITDTAQDILVVSNSAVKNKNGVTYVETFDFQLDTPAQGVQGGTSSTLPKQTAVTVGLSDDSNTEIISGLKEGDIIVTKTITASSSSKTTSGSGNSTKSNVSATRMLSGGLGGGPRE